MPVTVQAGERSVDLGPDDMRWLRGLPTGKLAVRVEGPEGLLEEGSLELSRRHDVNAWNVLGSALLYREHFAYVADGASEPELRDPDLYCG